MIFRENEHKLYHELATTYDLFYSKVFNYQEFYESIAPSLQEKEVETILEVACGTGRLMKILEEKGYSVTGLDLSQDMLDIARSRVKGNLIHQDMRDIRINTRFDAVICLGSSFTYMQSDEDVEKALHSFYTHLEPGGVLMFDNIDYDRFDTSRHGKWKKGSHRFDEVEITSRTWSSDWNPMDGTWNTKWEWIIKKGDDICEIVEIQRLKSFRFSDLQEKLRETGFKNIEKIDNSRLLIQAEK